LNPGTTSKTKIELLSKEVFSKTFNPQNDGHLEQIWVAIYYLSGFSGMTFDLSNLRVKKSRVELSVKFCGSTSHRPQSSTKPVFLRFSIHQTFFPLR